MKTKKAEGVDGIPAEFWKVMGDKAMKELVKLCQEMYIQGVWPKDFTRVVMIPLPKKANAVECGDYRTISLIPHVSWTLKKEEIRRLAALEMWIWRRMERVSWRDKKTNDKVLLAVYERKSIIERIMNRKKNWMGHVLRGNGLLKDVIKGRMLEKRPKGRKRIRVIDDLKDGSSYEVLKRRVEDRVGWRRWIPRTCL